MNIRKATMMDLDAIMPIYERARVFMEENGNPNQWGDGYPQRDVIEADIQNENFYVCEKDDEICGGFALIYGNDPTYDVIEEGAWLNEEPYATIHRLVSARTVQGVAEQCFQWCWERHQNLRIDTHEDNAIMQYVIQKAGFWPCGIIYVRDKTQRLAFQKVSEFSK